jgi:hypothetical protein
MLGRQFGLVGCAVRRWAKRGSWAAHWLIRPEEKGEGRRNGPRAAYGGAARAGGLKGRGAVKGLGSFFFNLFKSFSNFKLKHLFNFSTLKLFKPYFSSFQIILKTFKTSHKQLIKPCIQNMMHKHLLLLNY